jgi:hypothetical protein
MPYHRLESPTQTRVDAQIQTASQELWGRPSSASTLPAAKAYRNSLPNPARGIEFDTQTAPTKGSGTPFEARWYVGTNGVRQVNSGGIDYAVISIRVAKNTQVP